MDLSPGGLFAGLLVSGAGLVCLRYGKREARLPPLLTGVALLADAALAPGWAWDLGLAAACLSALWLAVRLGL